ncbi:sulfurtransferase [Glaciecola sp. 1036]|uniref:sulfurtransferase n=1 Tax=Alteromonadaceae TaxID=72275 RepID=UPI003D021112
MSIISTQELQLIIENNYIWRNKNVQLLFTTMDSSGPGVKPDIVKQNPEVRIPNSIFFDFQHDVVDKSSPYSNTMPSLDEFETAMNELGINPDNILIVYDDFGNFCASRVWFMLKSAGVSDVFVLSGGLPKWLQEERQVTSSCISANKIDSFVAKPSTDYVFVNADEVLSNIETNTYSLLDARSPGRFSGQEQETRVGLRSGHIPNSVNLHYKNLQQENGEFKSIAEISHLLADIEKENGLIFSCGSGVTACILAQAADMLDLKPLKVFDGSWSQWGKEQHLPIKTGS